MKLLLAAVAMGALLAPAALAQTVQGQVTAGVSANQNQLDTTNARQVVCRINPRNRNCSAGPRPEQRQPGQRRTGGVGGGPRP